MVDLPAPDGPTIATVRPAGTSKEMPLQDRPRRLVGEVHVLEADRALGDDERRGAGPILDLGLAAEDREHLLDVDHRLLDLAIDHAHEIERLVELDHHGVDHDEVADRLGAGLDAVDDERHRRR